MNPMCERRGLMQVQRLLTTYVPLRSQQAKHSQFYNLAIATRKHLRSGLIIEWIRLQDVCSALLSTASRLTNIIKTSARFRVPDPLVPMGKAVNCSTCFATCRSKYPICSHRPIPKTHGWENLLDRACFQRRESSTAVSLFRYGVLRECDARSTSRGLEPAVVRFRPGCCGSGPRGEEDCYYESPKRPAVLH